MTFHDLASLPPPAVAAVAQTCEALITAEGTERATPRERQLLATLFPALLGQPWPAQPAATMRMSKESVNAAATALNHATSYMAHDQIALAASSPESRAARDQALR